MKSTILAITLLFQFSSAFASTSIEERFSALEERVERIENRFMNNSLSNRTLFIAVKSFERENKMSFHIETKEEKLREQFTVLKECLNQVQSDFPSFDRSRLTVEFSPMNYSGKTVKVEGYTRLVLFSKADVSSCYKELVNLQ